FVSLLNAIDDAYHNRRDEVEQTAIQLNGILTQLAEPAGADAAFEVNDQWLEKLVHRSTGDFDPDNGGFGGAPKFPRETLLEMLLTHVDYKSNPKRLERVLSTLDAMAAGGIRDHL